MFRNASLANSGTYKCVLENGITEDSIKKDVVIHEPIKPFVTANISSETVVEHYRNCSLDCGLTGTPVPTYRWMRNGHLLNENNKLLFILRASEEDDGIFECEARNRAGSATNEFSVRVTNVPRKLQPWIIIIMIFLGTIILVIFLVVLVVSKKKAHLKGSSVRRGKTRFVRNIHGKLFISYRFSPVFVAPIARQTTVQSDITEIELLPSQPTCLDDQESTPIIEHTIPPQNLRKKGILGSGQFGIVYKGFLTVPAFLSNTQFGIPVAIKGSTYFFNYYTLMCFQKLKKTMQLTRLRLAFWSMSWKSWWKWKSIRMSWLWSVLPLKSELSF